MVKPSASFLETGGNFQGSDQRCLQADNVAVEVVTHPHSFNPTK
jgi:hypothetical protein